MHEALEPFSKRYYYYFREPPGAMSFADPHWNPDLRLRRGRFSVAIGHPLLCFPSPSAAPTGVYAHVSVQPNPPVPRLGMEGRFRARTLDVIRILGPDDVEFSRAVIRALATDHPHDLVRWAAITRLDPITDKDLLRTVMGNDRDDDVQVAAMDRMRTISEEDLLILATDHSYWRMRLHAMERLSLATHHGFLAHRALSDSNDIVRKRLTKRIAQATRRRP